MTRLLRHLLSAGAAIAIVAIPLAASVEGQAAGGAFTVIETGRSYARLQDAVNAVGDARGSISIAPGTYRQCAVQEAGYIAYLAAQPGGAIFDSTTCEGKAALVLRGRGAEVSGLVFRNMRVPDFNGAGIRLEKGDLTVADSWFADSQQGILTAFDNNATMVVDRSTFTGLGTCEGAGGCAHSIYTGPLSRLRVTNSRFEKGRGGHYVKARAAVVEIAGNSFDDSHGRATNYMIDLPAGSRGQITDNWFVQGQDKENYSAFIAVGAETIENPSEGLVVGQNTARFAPGVDRKSAFVANWTGERLALGDNRLSRNLQPYEER